MNNSSRLIYRKLEKKDFNLFYELYSNYDVMRYAYLNKFESKDYAIKEFTNILKNQDDNEKSTHYVAILKEINVSIGIVDYEVEELNKNGGIFEIGYFIKPEFWGQGFGTEMGRTLIAYLFSNYNIHKISASCHGNNTKSESIMTKLGMTKEGVIRKSRYKNNGWYDEIKYGVLKEEWQRSLKN